MLQIRRLTVGSLKKGNENKHLRPIQKPILQEKKPSIQEKKTLRKQACFRHQQNNYCVDLTSNNDKSLLDLSLQQQLDIKYKCKQGKCGKCEVQLQNGIESFSEPTAAEITKLGKKLSNNFRLSCQTYIKRDK